LGENILAVTHAVGCLSVGASTQHRFLLRVRVEVGFYHAPIHIMQCKSN